MVRVLKNIAKRLPHPLLMRSYHYWHMSRHRSATQRAARHIAIPMLDTLDLGTVKTSDTLFVLGSGPSINDISPKRWADIAKDDSVAFNFWPFHPFVPRMYFFESISYDDAENNCTPEMFKNFRQMLSDRAEAYRDVVKVITDVGLHQSRQLIWELPETWKPNLFAAYTVPVLARTTDELTAGVRYLSRHRAFCLACRIEWFFKYCGTLSAMITLGARMNYRRIVLCGVDMGKQVYFFQDPTHFPLQAHLEFVPRNRPHQTAVGGTWMVSMQEVVAILMQEVLEPAGIELYLESSSSALAGLVPARAW